jgi:hypothetical protein
MWGLLQLFDQNTLIFQLLRTKLEALRQKHRALLAAGNGDGDEKRRLVTGRHQAVRSQAALWNRNYFLRFRFRLLKSYGSGFYF